MIVHDDGSVTYTANEHLAKERIHQGELTMLHSLVGMMYDVVQQPNLPDYLEDFKHHFFHYAARTIQDLRTLAGKKPWEV